MRAWRGASDPHDEACSRATQPAEIDLLRRRGDRFLGAGRERADAPGNSVTVLDLRAGRSRSSSRWRGANEVPRNNRLTGPSARCMPEVSRCFGIVITMFHQDHAPGVTMLEDIVEVRALGGHRIHLRFEAGAQGELDLGRLIRFRGVFAPLRDEQEFARVRVDKQLGTVVWPHGADLDPDVLYSELTGQPIEVGHGNRRKRRARRS